MSIHHFNPSRALRRLGGLLAAALLLTGCSIQEAEIPSAVGPSEFGLSITLTATPDAIPQDGTSQSTITAVVRNAQGQPQGGVALRFAASTPGVTLTDAVKTTDANGRVTVGLIAAAAPAEASTSGTTTTVMVTPVSDNFGNTVPRMVDVRLVTPAGTPTPNTNPVAAFTILPAVANINQQVTFDASSTTDENVVCGTRCTYRWDFGDFSVDGGRTVTHRYTLPATYTVTLTVVDDRGGVASTQRTLTVSGPAAPVAAFVVAPTSPSAGATVTFNASATTVGAGATIASYTWDFGDNSATQTRTTPGINHTYVTAGTYLVTLTVTDSLGRTATRASSVTVVP